MTPPSPPFQSQTVIKPGDKNENIRHLTLGPNLAPALVPSRGGGRREAPGRVPDGAEAAAAEGGLVLLHGDELDAHVRRHPGHGGPHPPPLAGPCQEGDPYHARGVADGGRGPEMPGTGDRRGVAGCLWVETPTTCVMGWWV